VDGTSEDIGGDWSQVDDELHAYDQATGKKLSSKPILTVLTKIDGLDPAQIKQKSKILSDLTGDKIIYAISSQAHRGLKELLHAAHELVQVARREREEAEAANELPVITTTDLPDFWRLEPAGDNAWRLTGARLEGFARRTDYDSPDAVARLQDILRKTGVAKELRRQGAEAGDTIHIGPSELEWDG
jgi:GTP-binding protein